ncbi:MAG TPA: PAS domain S-box protein [Rubrobacter sp.]|nr:PAS domain S-box protein [Rubrobacter sp.]
MTGHERAEGKLRDPEEGLSAIFELASVGVVLGDAEGRVLRVNPKMCEITGYSEEELLGKTPADLTHPDDVEQDLERFRRMAAGETPVYGREKRYLRKDGQIRWVSVNATPIRDEARRLLRIASVILDITERKQAEETLGRQARQERLRAEVGAALAGGGTLPAILRWCVEALVTHLGAAFARVWTLDEEEDVLELQASAGMYTHTDGFHGRVPVGSFKIGLIAQERQPHLTNDVLDDPRVHDKEWARHEGMLAFAGYPLIVEGRVVGVMALFARQVLAEDTLEALASVADVIAQGIQRKRAEEDLTESRERYRAVVEQATEGIYILDTENGHVLETNPALGGMLGYTAEELREMDIHDLVAHPREEVYAYFERVLAEGQLLIGERKYRRKDGSLVDVEVSASMIHFGTNEMVCVVVRDVTERKRTEEVLREMREAERNRIARDLHDGALQDLSYALAETRHVLSVAEAPELDRRLGRVVEALERTGPELRSAIYDLRLEEERNKPLAESLGDFVELNPRMTPVLDIELDVDSSVPARPLGEKGAQLLRIVQEALTNVRRHSGSRNAMVSLMTEEDLLVAEVADDGRGFDLAVGSPAGLGTRGMRERARALKGELKIESEPSRGTKVRFEMPLKRQPEEPEEIQVLLVEDHASFRQAAASAFESEAGLEVVGQAGSLAEARKILAQEAPDVAVIDLVLPDGYGWELIKELRAGNRRAQALVLTAELGRAEIARAVENGAAGVLHKTAQLEEVVEAVRRLSAGEALLLLEEVVELLRFASSRKDEEHEAQQAIARLTPREREILQTLAEGLDSHGIAERLYISLRTERNHMTSIFAKLGAHSRLRALVFAVRHCVVSID